MSLCPEFMKYVSFRSVHSTLIFNNALCTFYFGVRVLNLYDLYSKIYRCSTGSEHIGSEEAPIDASKWTHISASSVSANYAQWEKTLLRLKRVWKFVLVMSILLLLSVFKSWVNIRSFN